MAEIKEFEILQELVIELDTGIGQNASKTSRVIGNLECAIVFSDVPINLVINSVHGYNILSTSNKGVNYISPRHKTQEPKENLMGGLQLDKFHLNEELDIIIDGPTNSDVKIILRFS